jgi:hypothetical protein
LQVWPSRNKAEPHQKNPGQTILPQFLSFIKLVQLIPVLWSPLQEAQLSSKYNQNHIFNL